MWCRRHAARYEQEFLGDMDMLACKEPDVLTRVSEYMDEIREYINRIHANGMAYTVNGSVYFDSKAYRCADISSASLAWRCSSPVAPTCWNKKILRMDCWVPVR